MTVQERRAERRRHAASLPQMEAGALFARFLALPEVEAADTVMVFYGTGREPDTVPLILALLERGKRVALPVVLPHRGMEARQVLDVDQLIPNRFGIPEPDGSSPVVEKGEIGAALIPHLMVDREGYRLGVPFPGRYECLLNSDEERFGGWGNEIAKEISAEKVPCHNKEYSISVDLPPYGAAVFVF